MNVWWLVGLSVGVVLTAILVLRLHAFLTLLLAGLLVAVLTTDTAIDRYAAAQVEGDKMSPAAAMELRSSPAPERLVEAFGETAGKIGIVIALASVIGGCLLESGAAATIVDSVLRLTGPKRAPEAIAASSFVLAIPVFFDTVFYLMVPLARSLRRKLGKDYVLFILATLAGGSIAHSLIPPTPGPLQVAEIIGVDVGTMLVAGLAIGSCTSILSLAAARLINRFVDVPLRAVDGAESEQAAAEGIAGSADKQRPAAAAGGHPLAASKEGPPLLLALLPIFLPVVLIATASVVGYALDPESAAASWIADSLLVLGDKNVALGLGCIAAFPLVLHCPQERRGSLVSRSLASAGNIILITAAGGAFGAMLRQAGIAEAVSSLADGVPGLLLLPVAFLVTTGIRTLQGSATVAMITAAGVLQGFAYAENLPFHPVYLAMAIGAGSKPISWMTDSGFWIITRMSGMTESEGLRTITTMSIAMGLSALLVTMIFAAVYPAV